MQTTQKQKQKHVGRLISPFIKAEGLSPQTCMSAHAASLTGPCQRAAETNNTSELSGERFEPEGEEASASMQPHLTWPTCQEKAGKNVYTRLDVTES